MCLLHVRSLGIVKVARAQMAASIADALNSVLPGFASEESVTVGLSCLAVQIILAALFAFVLPKGPWKTEPGFTAHQCVALPLMIYMAYCGCAAWFFDPANSRSSTTNVDRLVRQNVEGERLAQYAIAFLLFWDIPTSFFVSCLRETPMVSHHIGMFFVAYHSVVEWSYYALFFFGACEVSGIPLAIVDLFHPKHVEWGKYADASPLVSVLNNAARGSFVLLFMIVRAFYFPYVVFVEAWPDAYALYNTVRVPTDRRGRPTPDYISDKDLIVLPIFGLLFSLLQWYWCSMIIKQVKKMLFPPPPKAKRK